MPDTVEHTMANKQKFKLLVLVFCMVMLPGVHAQSMVTWRCGIALGYPPYQFQDSRGEPVGIDAEITRLVFSTLGENFRFIQKNWDDLYLNMAHQTGESDLLCGAEVNPGRLALFDFSEPYYRRKVTIFVKAGSSIQAASELFGKTVTGDRGGEIETIIMKNHFRLLTTPSKEAAFRLLGNNEVDAVIAPFEVGKWLARSLKIKVRMLPEQDPGSPVAFAVAKGNKALADRISKALGILKKSGAIDRIMAKYLN